MSPAVEESTPAPASKSKNPEMLSLFLSLLPKIPLMARVALLHVLQISEQSKYLDLRTALIVAVIRSFMTPSKPKSISSTQKLMTRDPGVKGRIWVSKYTSPVPEETSIRDSLVKAIEGLGQSASGNAGFRLPEIAPVEAEWTGYRAGAKPDSRLPDISEQEKYAELRKECKSQVTVMYFHGGAYWLMDPATHRPTTKKLAKLTGGKCYSVRYRLAPQNPFPSALLDALASYLTLLYPPPGAFHEPVSPEHIVFAGDSAGGNLSIALLQTILEMRRQNTKIAWFGQEREIPVPAAVAVNSPWMDITMSSSQDSSNAAYDYLPRKLEKLEPQDRPKCPAWPPATPRQSLYADDAVLLHPLVTLLTAQSWKGAPPVYICTGWELLADEDKYMARKLHQEGVPVVLEVYEAMPHCFALIFNYLEGSRRCFDGWSRFIRKAVEEPETIRSSFTTVKAKTLKEEVINEADLSPFTEDQMKERLYKRAGATVTVETTAKL